MDREIYRRSIAPHNLRVGVDGGVPSDNVQAAILLMQDTQPDIDAGLVRGLWNPELFGTKQRVSAPYTFATKVYSANSPQRELGDNIILNPRFLSSLNWTTSQAWSISNGEAVCTGQTSGDIIISSVAATSTKRWRIYVNIKTYVSGTLRVWTAGGGYYNFPQRVGLHYVDVNLGDFTYAYFNMSGNLFVGAVDFYNAHEILPADLSQTTANSQPYLDKIAPSEPFGLKNTNGDARFMSHSAVSFAAGDKWTLETVVKWNGSLDAYDTFASGNQTWIGFRRNNVNRFLFVNESGTGVFSTATNNQIIGKYVVITFIAKGDGTLSIYINGVFFETISVATNISITTILKRVTYFNGVLSELMLLADTMSASRIAYRAALLRSIFPEIPTVKVAGLDCAVRALDVVATPAGTVIGNITENANVEKITNAADREFTSDTGFWTKGTGMSIADGVAHFVNASGSFERASLLTIGKWYRVRGTISNRTSGGLYFRDGTNAIYFGGSNTTVEKYYLSTNIKAQFTTDGTTNLDLDNVSIEEVGWSGLTDLYNGLIAQGQTAAQAQAAVASWCHHSNDLALGSVYGKIYNGYAKDLLVSELASSNFGYHVATEAEWTAILAAGVNNLKKDGTAFWTSANGTNLTGLSLLGGGWRRDTGIFVAAKGSGVYWCADIDKAVIINDDGTSSIEAQVKTRGFYILLIKNYAGEFLYDSLGSLITDSNNEPLIVSA